MNDFDIWTLPVILTMLVSLVLFAIAAILSAVMDVVDQKASDSIFIIPPDESAEKKIFGIEWNYWFNISKGWLNKYEDRDPDKPIRTFKILFFTFEWTVFSDCWHFSKMLLIGMVQLNFLWLILLLPLNLNMSLNFDWDLHLPLILNLNSFLNSVYFFLPAMFILYALAWNLIFELFYTKILLKNDEITFELKPA